MAEPAKPSRRGGATHSERAARDAERGLRGLIGAGPSQVGVSGALRARDAARPTDDDLAAAERDVVVVRRHYTPPSGSGGRSPERS